MRILNQDVDLDRFFSLVKRSEAALLFLDYDGTLAPFHIDPSQAVPYSELLEPLNKLSQGSKVKVVIISGRAIEDLIPLLKIDPLPELWGSHGGEHLTRDGKYTLAKLSDTQKKGLKKGAESVNQIDSA